MQEWLLSVKFCPVTRQLASASAQSPLPARICIQAKQEEEQQKALEEAKRRQEAIRKREDEAAQRR